MFLENMCKHISYIVMYFLYCHTFHVNVIISDFDME